MVTIISNQDTFTTDFPPIFQKIGHNSEKEAYQEITIEVSILQLIPKDITKISKHYVGFHPKVGTYEFNLRDIPSENTEVSSLPLNVRYFDFNQCISDNTSLGNCFLNGEDAIKMAQMFNFVNPLVLDVYQLTSIVYNSLECYGHIEDIQNAELKTMFSSSEPRFLLLIPRKVSLR